MKLLTVSEGEQMAEILKRRANEIASYLDENRVKLPGSVEMALTREMARLRSLKDRIEPSKPEPDGDEETGT